MTTPPTTPPRRKAGRPRKAPGEKLTRIVAYVPPRIARLVEQRGGSPFVADTLTRTLTR